MRFFNSVRNLLVSWIGQAFIVIATFTTRYFFVLALGAQGKEYLGISGLFSNILSVLSLAELGIGLAISYSLFRPLQENDTETVKSIMHLFKSIYYGVGIFILTAGALLCSFLEHFIKEIPADIPIQQIRVYFLLYVGNIGISYFFSYKATLLIADQKKYIDELNYCFWFTCLNVTQIIFLIVKPDYFIYLALQIVFTLFQNLCISYIADKKYPFLKDKNVQPVKREISNTIKKNTFAMIFQKLGNIVVNATDNIVLSKFMGLVVVGVYANYYSVLNAINMLVSQLFSAIVSSVGNYNVTASEKEVENIFQKALFVNFWAYGVAATCLYCAVNPLITVWLAEDYILPLNIILVLCINFYLSGMRQSVVNFRNAMGIYWQDKLKPIVEAAINLLVSVALVMRYGTIGVFIGTTVSIIAVTCWWEPHTLYRYGFKCSMKYYYTKYIKYFITAASAFVITAVITQNINYKGIADLLIKGIIGFIITNLIYIIIYARTKEFQELLSYVWRLREQLQKGKEKE